MSVKATLLQLLFIFLVNATFAQASIIPKPSEIILQPVNDSFTLDQKTVIVFQQDDLKPSADFFNEYLQQVNGLTLAVGKKVPHENAILLKLEKYTSHVQGSYTLVVKKENISIVAGDESGIFYGIQTLLQLLPAQKTKELNLPLVQINDAPHYQYRGMMLDVARHFFSVDFVKKYIDYLAIHKLNYFHWHLTDDQGWRIEIKKYPKLTETGAYRNGTIIGHYPGTGNDGKRYGGFYTQKEIKDVVAYAAKRYITVIPEIEMPGHTTAALASYPWLGCTGGPYKVAETWGVFKDVYCAGNDSVFTFLQNVLDEVMSLFPSKYIHIGGDECPKDRWISCPKCQKRIKTNNLKDEHELQRYFIQRIEQYVNSKGRQIIGWDEILEGGLAPNATVMNWHGEKTAMEALKQKHGVIMTPNSHLYFDKYQAKPSTEPLAIGGYLPLKKVYSYNPAPEGVSSEDVRYIVGVQANLWTEYISTTSQVEYMIMPRLAALSEVAWSSPEQKSWDDFNRRIEKQYQRYDALGINYSKGEYDVQQSILLESLESKATVTLSTDGYNQNIYYTLDGSEPTPKSLVYEKPFLIKRSAIIKAAAFKNEKQTGKISFQEVIIH